MNMPATKVSLVCTIFLLCCASFVQSEPAPTPDPVVGRWRWIDNQIVICTEDNKFSVIPTGRSGTWKFLPGAKEDGKYVFTWDEGLFVDTLAMSEDKKTLKGKNEQRKKIKATKTQ